MASTLPSNPSNAANAGERIPDRIAPPMLSAPADRITPPTSAPSSPKSGANGDALPSLSRCGPKRVPRYAPPAKPTSESAPMRNPRTKPTNAKNAAIRTMTMSSGVNLVTDHMQLTLNGASTSARGP